MEHVFTTAMLAQAAEHIMELAGSTAGITLLVSALWLCCEDGCLNM